MARKFLYIVASLIGLVFAALLVLRLWGDELSEYALVPTGDFRPLPAVAANAYDNPAMWISHPVLGNRDPARWRPEGAKPAATAVPAAVFFIHPTSYLVRAAWNAPLDDAESRQRADLFVQGMGSAFGDAREVWAPRYRQAAFGAFLTDSPAALKALDVAYGDVLAAFDHFAAHADPAAPIVLAGHSQGGWLLRRLLADRVAGKPLARRVAAAYVIGWPVSLAHDLPAMGLPACAAPDQAGCIASWLSFAEPAETGTVLKGYARKPALDGRSPGGSAFLCTNPLTGKPGTSAPESANLGTLVPDATMKTGHLLAGAVPARCGADGFLLIGSPPAMGPYVLPGNNYHVYDIPLFWANVRADVARRVAAWKP